MTEVRCVIPPYRDLGFAVGDPRLPEDFWARVQVHPTSACWEWQSSMADGYARYTHEGRQHQAHRLLYTLLVGPIQAGLVVDHLCRTRHCVNPDHLDPVTNRENIRRGILGLDKLSRTHCPKGHEYSPSNTIRSTTGGRHCRSCHNELNRRAQAARRANIRQEKAAAAA
jgi:hypothetical protein